jgi:hypothetical protein
MRVDNSPIPPVQPGGGSAEYEYPVRWAGLLLPSAFLVAVQAQLFAALVLVNFRFPTLF